ncbi:MAG: hypothetical protein WAO76_11485 [Georgfuchsia sp.]
MTKTLRSWDEYVDLLRPAAGLLKKTWRPDDEEYRADLYRQLVMNISYAYFQYFQSNETHPEFMPLWNSVFLLQPNPDDVYYYAPLDGRLRYRIVGDRGTTHLINFQFGWGMMGMVDPPGKNTSYFEDADIVVDKNGKFEFVISAEKPPGYSGSWHRIEADTDYLIVRMRSYDWGNEKDTRMAIECLDAPALKRRMPPEEIAERLEGALTLSERWSKHWFEYQLDLLKRIGKNVFELNKFEGMGLAKQYYWTAIFDLNPGEALILETELPEERPYWNVQLNDPYFNAVEFVYRQTSLNGHSARVDADGKFRAVLSLEDPGVPNWLDPGEFRQGTIFGRWMQCSSAPLPTLRKVPLAEIRRHLPGDTPVVSVQERAESLRARRLGAQLRRRW